MSKRPFVFVTVRKKRLDDIAKNGLSTDVSTYRKLKKARKNKGVVLVVNRKALKNSRIKPKHILNIRPFRRAVHLVAGGGVLVRHKKGQAEVVLIYRRGKWDLPKGKRDRGESKRECAEREVNEELGIEDAHILAKLPKTQHGYRTRGRRFVIKTTHWYVMTTTAKEFVPQASEKITDARWVPLDEAMEKLGYKALRELLEDSREELLRHT